MPVILCTCAAALTHRRRTGTAHDISTSVLRAPHRSRVLRLWAEALTDGTMDEPGELSS
ncbi:hypothetical protein [Streptomyces sp. NPDC058751]|uniref:hypothetical protein n=1 Tax=Streptomyces sp. NPDC058751 TaxID=3346623 RepID=UPI0036A62674